MGGIYGCGWNLWVRRYIDFLILLIPTPLVSALFGSMHPYFFFHLKKKFFVLVPVLFCNLCNNFFAQYIKVCNCYCTRHGWYARTVWPNDMCVI